MNPADPISASPLASALYEGTVRHRRFAPRAHDFEFPLFMTYLDLGEIERVFALTRWWSATRIAPVRFRRGDYLAPQDRPLDEAVRRRVEQAIGRRPEGPIRLLTHLRCFGYVFNPVSFYYCFDAAGERVETILAEITNTPWRERHAYVLDRREASAPAAGPGDPLRWRFAKEFHVSPLLPMDLRYDWSFTEPGEDLLVHMNLDEPSGTNGRPPRVFDATLTLRRRALTPASMRAVVWRFPFLTARVIARIHFEFARTWLKGVRVHPHPGSSRRPEAPPVDPSSSAAAPATAPRGASA